MESHAHMLVARMCSVLVQKCLNCTHNHQEVNVLRGGWGVEVEFQSFGLTCGRLLHLHLWQQLW